MQSTSQSNVTQKSGACLIPKDSTSSSCSSHYHSDRAENMRAHINYSYPNVHGSTTPVSTRSSSSYVSDTTSCSSSGSRPKRSSMKSSFKTPTIVDTNANRRSSPPTVRFADPEPLSKRKTWSTPDQIKRQRPEPLINQIPNPLIKFQYQQPAPSNLISGPPRQKSFGTSPPPSVRPRLQQRLSLPVIRQHGNRDTVMSLQSPIPDDRWSGIPLPAYFSPSGRAPKARVASFQSAISSISNLSTQSALAVLSASPSVGAPQGQYNPLQNYIPCLYPTCSVHYTPAHAGPTYHFSQAPYSLSRLHGYCPRHATQELKEANLQCKLELENRRQNARRKTLGEIASEFDFFLESFREDRNMQDVALQHDLKILVLGAAQPEKQQGGMAWNWHYSPRICTTSGCQSPPYSPYANHLFAFYTTSRPSTFTPLRTLCPSCATREIEAFEQKTTEKWSSRCGWNEEEWDDWFSNTVKDREMEQNFWEKAQEREVREKGPARWVKRMEEGGMRAEKSTDRKGRRSLFQRMFGSLAG